MVAMKRKHKSKENRKEIGKEKKIENEIRKRKQRKRVGTAI
jgi:hypothetical protein